MATRFSRALATPTSRSDERLVAAVGVADLVIVDTADALLVAEKKASQDVKKVVERLEGANREEHRTHRKVYRPWGNYDSVHGGDGFKVKHIIVHPGQRLSPAGASPPGGTLGRGARRGAGHA